MTEYIPQWYSTLIYHVRVLLYIHCSTNQLLVTGGLFPHVTVWFKSATTYLRYMRTFLPHGENICRSKSNILWRYMHFWYPPCTYQNAWISIGILQSYEKWAVNPMKIIYISFTYKWVSTHKKFISIQWVIHTNPENVVPHWSASKVYVKVSIAVFHTHQTVLLFLLLLVLWTFVYHPCFQASS